MVDAVILRCRRLMPDRPDRIWYEYAPLVNGRPKRRPTHMMATVESASALAVRSGFTVHPDVINYRVP
jgi:hypothetical protein